MSAGGRRLGPLALLAAAATAASLVPALARTAESPAGSLAPTLDASPVTTPSPLPSPKAAIPMRIASESVQGQIEGLTLEPSTLVEGKAFLKIKGSFSRQDRRLLRGREAIPLGPGGALDFEVQVQAGENTIELESVSEDGKVEKLALRVVLAEAGTEVEVPRPSIRHWRAGLAPTLVSLQQSTGESASGMTLAARGGYRAALGDRWELNAGATASLLAVSGAGSSTSVRYLSTEASAGYSLATPKSPWTLQLNGGLAYATLFGALSSVGYRNLLWPRFFPELRREMAGGASAFGRIVYAPVGTSFALVSGLSYELGASAGYEWPGAGERNWRVSLDWSETKLTDPGSAFLGSLLGLSVGVAF